MIELEVVVSDLNRMLEKEKSIRKKICLESAIEQLNKYNSLCKDN